MRATSPPRRGFSGLGILVILIVIAIVLFMYFGGQKSYVQTVVQAQKQSKEMSLEIQAQQLAILVAEYRMSHNDAAPKTFYDMNADPESFKDQWGAAVRFRVDATGPGRPPMLIVISNGPDGAPDTQDDVTTAAPLPL